MLWSVGGNGSGATVAKVGNSEINPERIKELKYGVDLTWDNFLSVEMSSYIQRANNSVIYRPLAPSLGYGSLARPENIGSMEMRGLEALVRISAIRTKDLNLDISSSNDNVINKMGDPIMDNFGLVTIREGYPKYSLWGKVVGTKVDTFDLAILGQEGQVPYFDPINGILLEDDGYIGRLVPDVGNLSFSGDYKIFDFYVARKKNRFFISCWWNVVGNRP